MVFLILGMFFSHAASAKGISFFYGNRLPVNELSLYERVVLQPEHTSAWQIQQLKAENSKVIAYLSIGEGTDSDAQASLADIVAYNENWNSQVMDLTDKRWQDFLINQAKLSLEQGFEGFFLDTLDSYYLANFSEKEIAAQQQALSDIISKLKFIGADIIIQNRGFEVLSRTNTYIDAVAAESLFSGFDPVDGSYYPVDENYRNWLLARLDEAKAYGLEAIAIDYANDYQERAVFADAILAEDITPWVTNGMLTEMGTGILRPVARRVLIAYDSRQEAYSNSVAHRLFVPHLEYLGYLPDYIDIAKEDWPRPDKALYAGALFYLSSSQYSRGLLDALSDWRHQIPMLFLNDPPTDNDFLEELGVEIAEIDILQEIKFSSGQPWSFEADIQDIPYFLRPEIAIKNVSSQNKARLSVQSPKQQAAIAVTSTWGGIVLQPALFLSLPEGQRQWLLDPVSLLKEGLTLTDIPVADITTQNGRRIMTSHIDGDGFVSRAKFSGNPMSARIMLDQIIDFYKLPITVSVIEGEVGPAGLYPKDSEEAEALARKIFAKPHVEVASHSFSHPFYWSNLDSASSLEYGYHLPIEGYRLSIEREVLGSIDYINKNLTTPEKPVKLMLWTGNAMPDEQTIALTKKVGVLNVNGGNTKLVYGQASLTNLWPVGRPLSEGVQVYAPIMNENVYTELWQGAHFGYQRVLETYQLTDKPRRYKPISIYYHFYSAEDPAGVRALKRVYDGVLKQNVFPMYLSDYAKKAKEFYRYALAKLPDGSWFTKLQNIQTFRVPISLGYPNIEKSTGVIGYNQLNQNYYIHLNNTQPQLALSTRQETESYLIDTSATIRNWQIQKTRDGVHFDFVATSHLPFELNLHHRGACLLTTQTKIVDSIHRESRHLFAFETAVNQEPMTIRCR